MQVDWITLKGFATDRSVPIQFVTLTNGYWLKAFDGPFELECTLHANRQEEIDDFEANFKSLGNKSPIAKIVSRFEERDKTLKIACVSAPVDETTGEVTLLLKVPGTPGSGDGRWMSSGIAFFDAHTSGDKILSIHFTDEDNVLGAGAGYVVGSYTDDAADAANQGWYFPPTGQIKAESIGGYGFCPSGFYIKIVGKKAGTSPTGNLSANFEWGSQDG